MSGSFSDSVDSKNLKHYLKQIASINPLSPEEEKKLGYRIQKGDKDALDTMVKSNLKFVVSYVKKYRGMGLSLLDLINEGNIGLIEAAKRFDPEKKVKFISYAVWWIRQAIIHALTLNSRIYHIPQKLSDQISEMKHTKSKLRSELGRKPLREEVAKRMGVKTEDIETLEALSEKNISLSDKYFDEDTEVGDRIKDDLSPSVEFQIIKNSMEHQIRDFLEDLTEKEAIVLKLRFGFFDDQVFDLLSQETNIPHMKKLFKLNKIRISDADMQDENKMKDAINRTLPLTLQSVGIIMTLTRERIRQIEKKALRKLSRSHKLQQLRGYLN